MDFSNLTPEEIIRLLRTLPAIVNMLKPAGTALASVQKRLAKSKKDKDPDKRIDDLTELVSDLVQSVTVMHETIGEIVQYIELQAKCTVMIAERIEKHQTSLVQSREFAETVSETFKAVSGATKKIDNRLKAVESGSRRKK